MACDTPQYQAVHQQDNLKALITAIKTVYDQLESKFQTTGWYEPPQDKAKNAEVLAMVALNNIEEDVKNYEVFIRMLNEVGLKEVANKIHRTFAALSEVETNVVVTTEETDFVETPVASGEAAGGESVSVILSMSSAPSLTQLQSLRTSSEGETIQIIKEIAPQWKRIGACLDFDRLGTQLDLIYANKSRDGVEECCRTMFQHWLAGNGIKPASWKTLIQILKDCEYITLASNVTDVINKK